MLCKSTLYIIVEYYIYFTILLKTSFLHNKLLPKPTTVLVDNVFPKRLYAVQPHVRLSSLLRHSGLKLCAGALVYYEPLQIEGD